ncbi:MAG: LysM peptidoglycan-binding domain-containing protein [Caldilineaceae bacterium SB0668_bin_21]|nr:LysM peptidoglycan-binding domain-containing protein [Caldilineaceae bacterium SB0668_bin_21]MYC23720.1 LysM peptidoglycan-binding domain-containing protein [Caldilineaceae bacterium SB0662_bin_25]
MHLDFSWRYIGLVALLALVLVAGPYALTAQGSVESSTVSGQLNEQFAKHYLGLQVIDTSQPVTIKLDYQPQHSHILDDNSGFYVFKQSGFDRYINAAPPSDSAFRTGTQESMDGIKRKATQIGADDASEIVTIVVYNDTTMDFSYTLTGENVRFVDESGEQVVSGSTPAVPETSTPSPQGLQAAATPGAVVTTSAVRSTWVRGELNEQFAKHYLGLSVIDSGQPVTIKMEYDPQDSSQIDDSTGFYVFKLSGFDRYINAAPPSESVFVSGSLDSMDGIKRKVAEISIDDVGEVVALVTYNDTTMPFSYTLQGENVLFLDDSGEQVEGDRVVVQQPAAGTTASSSTSGTEISLGSTYTVKAGDTLGTISSQAYGTTDYWSSICTANSLSNCDLIEVGDVLTIPSQADADAYLAGEAPTPAATAVQTAAVTAVATPTATADAMPDSTATAAPAATADAMPEATATATPAATAMPEPTSDAGMMDDDLIEVAEDYEQLDILLLALDLAGLTTSVADGGPYTIFAPTNAAFASLPEARLDMLMADSELLADTLRYHIVSGKLTVSDLSSQSSLTTLHGGTIDISTGDDGSLSVEGISIVTSDVEASNGVIHFIHQLLPDPDDNNSQ